jgi:hypothetical protein
VHCVNDAEGERAVAESSCVHRVQSFYTVLQQTQNTEAKIMTQTLMRIPLLPRNLNPTVHSDQLFAICLPEPLFINKSSNISSIRDQFPEPNDLPESS